MGYYRIKQKYGTADNIDFFETKTNGGNDLSISLRKDEVHYSWVNRSGIKEGWENKTFNLTNYGTRKVIKMIRSAMPW